MIGLELSFQVAGKIFRCGFQVLGKNESPNEEESGVGTTGVEQKLGKPYRREEVGFTAKRSA